MEFFKAILIAIPVGIVSWIIIIAAIVMVAR
jgi:hypothetical protein